jgi:hypothetical protein
MFDTYWYIFPFFYFYTTIQFFCFVTSRFCDIIPPNLFIILWNLIATHILTFKFCTQHILIYLWASEAVKLTPNFWSFSGDRKSLKSSSSKAVGGSSKKTPVKSQVGGSKLSRHRETGTDKRKVRKVKKARGSTSKRPHSPSNSKGQFEIEMILRTVKMIHFWEIMLNQNHI